MPIYDISCRTCGKSSEVLVVGRVAELVCPGCGSTDTTKHMSPPSTLTGRNRQRVPGAGDTACCGSAPSEAGCAGPGSCCGRSVSLD